MLGLYDRERRTLGWYDVRGDLYGIAMSGWHALAMTEGRYALCGSYAALVGMTIEERK